MTGAASPWCQRWRHHQQSWRHASEGGFDATRYTVDELDERTAKQFLALHHYAGASYPAALRRYGMTDNADGQLVGVVVLGAPTSSKVLTSAFPTLEPYTESVEASRIALVDQVPSNGETWLLGRVFRLLRSAGVRGVVSFADPLPRRTHDGQLVKAGHIGLIYQASAGAIYTGRGTPRTLTLLPDGTVLNARAAQKVRAQEQGHRYVEQRLVDLGAALRRSDEDPAAWLTHALQTIGARKIRHRGNHRYLFRLGANQRDRDRIPIGLQQAAVRPRHPDQ